MSPVFADTLYWGAALHRRDQYRRQAIHVRRALGEVLWVTTDEVLTELLDGLAQRGSGLRNAAVQAVHRILNGEGVIVHPQSRESFLAGLRLYEQRSDKGYSLVDCVSMTTMRRHGITDVLLSDKISPVTTLPVTVLVKRAAAVGEATTRIPSCETPSDRVWQRKHTRDGMILWACG